MSKGAKKRRSRRSSSPPTTSSPTGSGGAPLGGPFGLGLGLLAIAVVLCLILTVNHLGGLALPGCGEGGGCAEAANSKYGKLPGLGWPLSFVGLAYFAGLLAAWIRGRTDQPPVFRHLVRLGAVGSLILITILFVEGYTCLYCLGSHLANLGFWGLLERLPLRAPSGRRGSPSLPTVIGVGLAVSGVLGVLEMTMASKVRERLDAEVDASVDEILADGGTTATGTNAAAGGFTGRHRVGPEQAVVRMVLFTDYQCSDCRAVEEVAERVQAENPNTVSLSIKHFPMDQKCNPHVGRSLHPNACWAARAAEAAGILAGDEGFFLFHSWLFEQNGSFTDASLPGDLRTLGFEPDEFIRTMSSQETLRRVQADIEEGVDLGLHFTPMIFLNGIQLRGVFEANADSLATSVARVISARPPAADASDDRPPPAADKAVQDWRQQSRRVLPAAREGRRIGSAAAPVEIVVWGDYQERSAVPVANAAIRAWMQGRDDVSYSYRHFPFDQDCNSSVPRSAHPRGCDAARLAEAAALLAGEDGFWKVHEWLFANQDDVANGRFAGAAAVLGVAPSLLEAAMKDARLPDLIAEDITSARPDGGSTSFLYRGSLPTIHVNGKVVPRWRLRGQPVLDRILDAAVEDSR